MRLLFKRDYMGWRMGYVADVDFGLADILVQRQIAKQADPPREPEEPPPRVKPRRTIRTGAEER